MTFPFHVFRENPPPAQPKTAKHEDYRKPKWKFDVHGRRYLYAQLFCSASFLSVSSDLPSAILPRTNISTTVAMEAPTMTMIFVVMLYSPSDFFLYSNMRSDPGKVHLACKNGSSVTHNLTLRNIRIMPLYSTPEL